MANKFLLLCLLYLCLSTRLLECKGRGGHGHSHSHSSHSSHSSSHSTGSSSGHAGSSSHSTSHSYPSSSGLSGTGNSRSTYSSGSSYSYPSSSSRNSGTKHSYPSSSGLSGSSNYKPSYSSGFTDSFSPSRATSSNYKPSYSSGFSDSFSSSRFSGSGNTQSSGFKNPSYSLFDKKTLDGGIDTSSMFSISDKRKNELPWGTSVLFGSNSKPTYTGSESSYPSSSSGLSGNTKPSSSISKPITDISSISSYGMGNRKTSEIDDLTNLSKLGIHIPDISSLANRHKTESAGKSVSFGTDTKDSPSFYFGSKYPSSPSGLSGSGNSYPASTSGLSGDKVMSLPNLSGSGTAVSYPQDKSGFSSRTPSTSGSGINDRSSSSQSGVNSATTGLTGFGNLRPSLSSGTSYPTSSSGLSGSGAAANYPETMSGLSGNSKPTTSFTGTTGLSQPILTKPFGSGQTPKFNGAPMNSLSSGVLLPNHRSDLNYQSTGISSTSYPQSFTSQTNAFTTNYKYPTGTHSSVNNYPSSPVHPELRPGQVYHHQSSGSYNPYTSYEPHHNGYRYSSPQYVPYYETPQYTYIKEYRNSGSRYSDLLTGLAIYNLGRSHSYHNVHYYHDDYYNKKNQNNDYTSFHQPTDAAVCTLKVKEENKEDVLKIPCEIVSAFTNGTSKQNATNSFQTTCASNTVNLNNTVMNDPVVTNATNMILAGNLTGNSTFDNLFAGILGATNLSGNKTVSFDNKDVEGNVTFTELKLNVTNTANCSTTIRRLETTDPLSVKGPPIDPSKTECAIQIRTGDAIIENKIDCYILLQYSKMPEPKKEGVVAPSREKLKSWLHKPPWWMSMLIAV